MKKYLLFTLAFLAAQAGSYVLAGPFATRITGDRVEDVLEDDSRSFFADVDMNGVVSVGDVVAGLVRIDRFNNIGLPATEQQIAVFAVEVTGVLSHDGTSTGSVLGVLAGAGIPNVYLNLGPSTVAGLTVADLLPFHTLMGGPSIVGALLTAAAAADPFVGTFAATLAALNTATYAVELEVGIDLAAGDFFEATLTDFDAGTGGPGDGTIEIVGEYAGIAPITPIGSERAGLSILWSSLPSSTTFLPVAVTKLFPPFPSRPSTMHDLALTGNFLTPDPGLALLGYPIQDNAKAFLNPQAVPEPSGLALLALGVTAAAIFRRKAA